MSLPNADQLALLIVPALTAEYLFICLDRAHSLADILKVLSR